MSNNNILIIWRLTFLRMVLEILWSSLQKVLEILDNTSLMPYLLLINNAFYLPSKPKFTSYDSLMNITWNSPPV